MDEEHRALTIVPEINDIIREVRLIYYVPDLHMPKHIHAVAQFSTLISGQARESTLGKSIDNHHGIAEFKPIAYEHSNKIGPEGAMFLSVNIDPAHDSFIDEFGKLDWCLSASSRHWHNITALFFQGRQLERCDLEAEVFSLLGQSLSPSSSVKQVPNWLMLAKQALAETNMSVAKIADDVGVHRVHLSRMFQSCYGISTNQYRHRIMLQKGISAMLNSDQSLANATYQSGFSDQSHFTRTFKKQIGVTPKQFSNLFSR